MTTVSIRIMAPDQATLRRAAAQLEHQVGARFGSLPNHPGSKGDWLSYGSFEVYIPPTEATRRRPAVERAP
jgi:hypothetical protein